MKYLIWNCWQNVGYQFWSCWDGKETSIGGRFAGNMQVFFNNVYQTWDLLYCSFEPISEYGPVQIWPSFGLYPVWLNCTIIIFGGTSFVLKQTRKILFHLLLMSRRFALGEITELHLALLLVGSFFLSCPPPLWHLNLIFNSPFWALASNNNVTAITKRGPSPLLKLILIINISYLHPGWYIIRRCCSCCN